MTRIAIGGFLHETNSFATQPTDTAYFRRGGEMPPLCRGEDIVRTHRGRNFSTSGFLAEMLGRCDLVPLVWAHGGAGGTVTDDAFDTIAGELLDGLARARPVDAVYLDLHGAMVTQSLEDAEGELLARIRALLGAEVPIVISLDYHANVSARMVALSDGMTIYRTYPHVDREHTGARAARVLMRVLAEGRPIARSVRHAPFLVPLPFQSTLIEPSASIVAASAQNYDVLDLGYAAGFPASDTSECGPAVFAHGFDQRAVDAAVVRVMAGVLGAEAAFAQPLYEARAGVRHAMSLAAAHPGRPVVIADTQDNPGAGGSSDTTGVLEALLAEGARGAALAVMTDAQAAAAAHAAGVRAELALALGGRGGPLGVTPLSGTFRVLALGDGRFRATGPWFRGRDVDLGPMALLSIGGVEVVVASKRMQAGDQEVFRHLGVEPATRQILALKSSVHFRADFEPIAQAVLVVVAPGWHVTDPAEHPYRKLRAGVRLRPLGPRFHLRDRQS